MNSIDKLATESCVTVRRANQPDPDGWMQHAWDNPALDITVEAGNLLGKPVVVFLGIVPSVLPKCKLALLRVSGAGHPIRCSRAGAAESGIRASCMAGTTDVILPGSPPGDRNRRRKSAARTGAMERKRSTAVARSLLDSRSGYHSYQSTTREFDSNVYIAKVNALA